jgi:FHA domain
MTTKTSLHPRPVGPAAPASIDPDARATSPLELQPRQTPLDALPLLDHHSRHQTISPRLALRGEYLELADGQETWLLHLRSDVTHVGRGSGAEVRFDEHRVSRDHAIFVRHGRHVRLLDNRSANGTFVNGRRIVATNIANGDVIEIGPVVMRFVVVP